MNILNLDTVIDNEQLKFLSTIYHDARGGYGMRVHLRENKKPITVASKDITKLIVSSKRDSMYIALSTHTGTRRIESQLFNRSVFYVDLDAHGVSSEETELFKEETIKKLNKAFHKGDLPIPTMVTDSGRGLGIYYCLEKSISATGNAEKINAYYRELYIKLFDAYEQVLGGTIKIDRAVSDSSRICRLPGTINKAAGKPCRLIYHRADYYTLKSLYDGIRRTLKEVTKTNNQLRRFGAPAADILKFDGIKDNAFLLHRLTKLSTLAKLRTGEGFRQTLLFIAYNTALGIYNEDTAYRYIANLNDELAVPLSPEELATCIKSAPYSKDVTGKKQGLYKFTDDTILKLLSVTDEENAFCRFGMSYSKQSKREQRKIENRKKRLDRNEEIRQLVLFQPDLTYKEIAAVIGCSLITVKRAIKTLGIGRYNIPKDEETLFRPSPDETKKNSATEEESSKKGTKTEVSFGENFEKVEFPFGDSFPSKVSFYALKHCYVPLDDENPFIDKDYIPSLLLNFIEKVDDPSEKYFWGQVHSLGMPLLHEVLSILAPLKPQKFKQYDQEITSLLIHTKGEFLGSAVSKWCREHDPAVIEYASYQKKKENYARFLASREEKKAYLDVAYADLNARFDDAKELVRNFSFSSFMQLKYYYFKIFKYAKNGNAFYPVSGTTPLCKDVVKILLSLTADDFASILRKTGGEEINRHAFTWYLSAFLNAKKAPSPLGEESAS